MKRRAPVFAGKGFFFNPKEVSKHDEWASLVTENGGQVVFAEEEVFHSVILFHSWFCLIISYLLLLPILDENDISSFAKKFLR